VFVDNLLFSLVHALPHVATELFDYCPDGHDVALLVYRDLNDFRDMAAHIDQR
jgi:hypothetical protein